MTQEQDRDRDVRDRIRRLRERLRGSRPDLAAIIKGILDLLDDEL